MREEHRSGLQYLEAATALLRRVRNAHPTKGTYEAADLQWWWRNPRATDDLDQLFWFDELGRPEAAVIATAGGIVSNPETYGLLLRRTHTVWISAQPDEHMGRVMKQGDFRPMAKNRQAMADLHAILEARGVDYARAETTLDTSGATVQQSFAKLGKLVAPWMKG